MEELLKDVSFGLNPTIPIGKQSAEAILVREPKPGKEEVYNRVEAAPGYFVLRKEDGR